MTELSPAAVAVAVVVFPGSNCEHDAVQALSSLGARAELVWHTERSLEGFDAVVVPGGFAHGDYLRPGAIARFSPVMNAVSEAAALRVPVLGICNGFQVLTEAHLLPGALQRNRGGRFLCEVVECEVVSTSSVLTAAACSGQRLRLPLNHFEGNYTCGKATLLALESRGQIPLRYVTNPNGSMGAIAAVANEAGNVVGLMPHPERACNVLTGSVDGRVLLTSFLRSAANRTSWTRAALTAAAPCA
jgi:phosphoribosylformylglycinamidine synthase subunit PurQ / glutaminase